MSASEGSVAAIGAKCEFSGGTWRGNDGGLAADAIDTAVVGGGGVAVTGDSAGVRRVGVGANVGLAARSVSVAVGGGGADAAVGVAAGVCTGEAGVDVAAGLRRWALVGSRCCVWVATECCSGLAGIPGGACSSAGYWKEGHGLCSGGQAKGAMNGASGGRTDATGHGARAAGCADAVGDDDDDAT